MDNFKICQRIYDNEEPEHYYDVENEEVEDNGLSVEEENEIIKSWRF